MSRTNYLDKRCPTSVTEQWPRRGRGSTILTRADFLGFPHLQMENGPEKPFLGNRFEGTVQKMIFRRY